MPLYPASPLAAPGVATASKGAVYSAARNLAISTAVVACAGTDQATAAAITADVNVVTGSDGLKGVRLPAGVIDYVIEVVNLGVAMLPVYPATGGTINVQAVNSSFSVGPTRSARFRFTATTQIYVEQVISQTSASLAQFEALSGVPPGTGAVSKALVLDANGDVVMPTGGHFNLSIATPAAAGSTQAGATVLTAQSNLVTGADGVKGVALPAAAANVHIYINNTSTTAPLLVYPINGGNDAINARSANAAFTMAPGADGWFIATSATQWYTREASVSANVNIIQNGGMLFDQANEGAAVTISGANQRSADRWFATIVPSTSGVGNPTIQQQTASSGLPSAAKSLLVTASATPSTSTPAALRLDLIHRIEAGDVADLGFGVAGAQSLTVSLWLKSSIANANYSVGIRNGSVNRSYLHICNVASANTWTQCSFTIPGDVTGTWNTTPGTAGPVFSIGLAEGTLGTPDTWTAGSILGVTGQTQFTDTASATLEVALIKMERGSTATIFVPDSTEVLRTKLQRYYRKSFPLGTAPAQSAGVAGATCVQNPIAGGQPSVYIAFNPPMYASPTIVTYNPSAANANWRNVTAASDIAVSVDPATAKSTTGVQIAAGATVANLADNLAIHYTASTTF